VEWVESAWDEEQRGWMIALAEWEADRCPVCGGDPADCQSPDADRNNPRSTWIYRAGLPVECHRGTARRIAVDRHAKDAPDDRRALLFPVEKRPRGGRRRRNRR